MNDIMKMGKNPNYIGSWDLYDIASQEITVTIKAIKDEEVINNGKSECCTVAYFIEDCKPMILNLTNKKTLTKLYKTKIAEQLIGKRITIGYEKIKAFGKISDALRIKSVVPNAPKVELPKCSKCNGNITAAHGMTPEQVAAYTAANYGEQLCGKCAADLKKQKEAENEAN
jgi:hypothetical protein